MRRRKFKVLYRLATRAQASRGRIRTCISRFLGEVTAVFTTGQTLIQKLAGEPTRRADSGHDIFWYFSLRGYASVPKALIPGRAAVRRVESFGAMYLFSFTTGETRS